MKTKRFMAATGAAMVAAILARPDAYAWDSRIHEDIATLAVQALPPSPLADFFSANDSRIASHAVEPDTVLKDRYAEDEAIRHYIDIERFEPGEFDALIPDYGAMEQKYGQAMLKRSGTLPWAIEDEAEKLHQAWQSGDCKAVLTHAGYLAHYVGDASQPLHSTVHYDGYDQDKGIHDRIEKAADRDAKTIWRDTRGVSPTEIVSVWSAAIDEIRDAHTHVDEVIKADRAARSSDGGNQDFYQTSITHQLQPLFEAQISRAASVLASIWLVEWKMAGSPATCSAQAAGNP
jgi:zinc dependent phospholipase C